VVRPDQIDAGHVQPHRAGGAHGDRSLLGREPDLLGGGAPVQVGPELTGRALPPAQQHAEAHLVAPGERQLDARPAPGDHDRRADHRSPLDGAVARPHVPPLHELGRADDREREVVLAGMHHEPHERTAGTVEHVDVPGVERRRSGAGVDLGLDCVDAQLGQGDPLAPPDRRQTHALRR
jgi:hypothetical protein